jgi:putative nucleotidyltransferase with HDIG domain
MAAKKDATSLNVHTNNEKRLTFGLLVGRLTERYQSLIWRGVIQFAEEHDINLICYEGRSLNSPYRHDEHRNKVFEFVDPKTVDGLIIISGSIANYISSREFENFCRRYAPIPMVSLSLAIDDIPSITLDHERGMRDAIRHLVRMHGIKRIAFIRGPEGHQEAERRFETYRGVLSESGIDYNSDLVVPGNFNPLVGSAAIATLLDERKINFEAVVAANDEMAINAMEELKKRGFRIPEDVAVVGFDDREDAQSVIPSLSTVRQPIYEMGYKGAELLLAIMQGEEHSVSTVLPTEFIIRRSCGCFLHNDAVTIDLNASVSYVEDEHPSATENIDRLQAAAVKLSVKLRSDWARSLWEKFWADIDGESWSFLEFWIEAVRSHQGIGVKNEGWHELVWDFMRSVKPLLSKEQRPKAEGLCRQAHSVIDDSLAQAEKERRMHLEDLSTIQAEINHDLLTSLNLEQLSEVIARELPRLGIRSMYLSLFRHDEHSNKNSTLVLGYNENGAIKPANGLSFPTIKLLPGVVLPEKRRCTLIVELLHFRDDELGIIALEMGPDEGLFYEALSAQISSTLKTILFYEEQKYAKEELKLSLDKLRRSIEGTIMAMALMVEIRDPYTAGHQRRVSQLASAIAQDMRLPKEMQERVQLAAMIHDVGKIKIPAEILSKPGRITQMEFKLIQTHAEVGYEILKNIDLPWPIDNIVFQHHERMDGSGYPLGILGGDILMEARIIGVADVVEAMSSHRPYRPALGMGNALQEIRDKSGVLYDPQVAEACLRIVEKDGFKFEY